MLVARVALSLALSALYQAIKLSSYQAIKLSIFVALGVFANLYAAEEQGWELQRDREGIQVYTRSVTGFVL